MLVSAKSQIKIRKVIMKIFLFSAIAATLVVGCQTVPKTTSMSKLESTPDISGPANPIINNLSPLAAASEIELENARRPKQSNHRFEAAVAGNFDGADFVTHKSPQAYVDFLWGQKNPNQQKGWKLAQESNWRDDINFYTLNGTSAFKLRPKVSNPDDFCLHAGHFVVAKFNNDELDDAAIACTGYDGKPFPGEHSYVMLSAASGGYRLHRLTSEVSYYHGATTLDINSDGLSDVVLTDESKGRVLGYLNLGNGKFSTGQTLLSGLSKNYTTTAVDLNNDRHAELIVGGHEVDTPTQYMPTTVFWNDGYGNFSFDRKTTLPKVAGYGIVLDYLYYAPYLFTVRTQSGKNAYQGGAVQQIDVRDFTEVAVLKNPRVRHPAKLQRVYSPSGKIVFGSLDCDRNGVDFILNDEGAMSFVRESDGERTPAGCLSITP